MGIIADLILIAILLMFVITGYKKGLTGSLIKLLSFILSVVLAIILYKPISGVIKDKTQIDENIRATISNIVGEDESSNQQNNEEKNIPTNMFEEINNNIENATQEAKMAIIEETSNTIINITSGLIVFIIARLILFIVGFFVEQITKLPVLRQVDQIGGIAYGIVEGILIIYIVLSIISLTSMIWQDNIVVSAVTNSVIGNMMYNNNIVLKLLFK